MLTGFSLSSSLIGVSGHWDGCMVEEKDEAATRPMHCVRKQTSPVAFVKLVAAIRGKSPGSDSFIVEDPQPESEIVPSRRLYQGLLAFGPFRRL